MNEILISYRFSIRFKTFIDGFESISYGIDCSEFPMLAHLAHNDLATTQQVVIHLEAIIASERSEMYKWGTDFCLIKSHHKTSIIHHYEGMTQENYDYGKPLQLKIPTPLLLKLMIDWKLFLEKMPKHLFENRKA